MPLNVSFQLSDDDLAYFRERMHEAQEAFEERNASEVAQAAAKMIAEMRQRELPDFVNARMEKLELLARMVEDSEWRLDEEDRNRVLRSLAYLLNPHDDIPDRIPGVGFLDDAIMAELVCQDLRHEIEAYADFCRYRADEEKRRGTGHDAATREEWLSARRIQLHERMKRRRASIWRARLGRDLW
ncbi:MAG TPA: YkvA family protein [Pseudomonadales bacterium]